MLVNFFTRTGPRYSPTAPVIGQSILQWVLSASAYLYSVSICNQNMPFSQKVWFWSHNNRTQFQWYLLNFGTARHFLRGFYEGHLSILSKSLLLWRWHLVCLFIVKSLWCSSWWHIIKLFSLCVTSYLVKGNDNIRDSGYQKQF